MCVCVCVWFLGLFIHFLFRLNDTTSIIKYNFNYYQINESVSGE